MPLHQSHQRLAAGKHRARLTEAEVQSIYLAKITGTPATKVASWFGVNEKTIRDIWSGRTWAKETLHISNGDSKNPRFSTQSFQRKQLGHPSGTIPQQTAQLPPDHKSECRNKPVFRKLGQREEVLQHPPDSYIAGSDSLDEQLWKWDEAIWCDLSCSDPFKLDWKPRPCVF